ncbi:protein rapunzel-like [Protopterus annectens]|uniref:protein rapunzel-like n=1 Tax=Protopterus annectens TaxID=7888 RepID=UPI001CF97AEF|nr:protein rapunzel-like [Protopterus annectens]XP_043910530.1 protein rapunzel-like [Protopterus annectens]XP_043910531.1 protein rapunzel-like [Protopterus annectens]
MSDEKKSREEIKEKVGVALDCLGKICTAASGISPIFGIAGCLLQLASASLKGEELDDIKTGFRKAEDGLQGISEGIADMMLQIKEDKALKRFNEIEFRIKNQFRAYVEAVECEQERKSIKIDDFLTQYTMNGSHKHICALYDSVMGNRKLFSEPILKVYMDVYRGNKNDMKKLCDHLKYLFAIGIITYMEYVYIVSDGDPGPEEEWKSKSKDVWDKMDAVLKQCK